MGGLGGISPALAFRGWNTNQIFVVVASLSVEFSVCSMNSPIVGSDVQHIHDEVHDEVGGSIFFILKLNVHWLSTPTDVLISLYFSFITRCKCFKGVPYLIFIVVFLPTKVINSMRISESSISLSSIVFDPQQRLNILYVIKYIYSSFWVDTQHTKSLLILILRFFSVIILHI